MYEGSISPPLYFFFQLMHSNMKMASAMGTTTKVGYNVLSLATFY